jgi:hypothetical protein
MINIAANNVQLKKSYIVIRDVKQMYLF